MFKWLLPPDIKFSFTETNKPSPAGITLSEINPDNIKRNPSRLLSEIPLEEIKNPALMCLKLYGTTDITVIDGKKKARKIHTLLGLC